MNDPVENYPSARLLNDSLVFVGACTGRSYPADRLREPAGA